MNRNLNPAEFGDGPIHKGDPSQPLYRLLDVPDDDRDPLDHLHPNLGMHWTHDFEETQYFMHDSTVVANRGIVLQADHPGNDHVMDWDNPDDAPLMERAIGPRDNLELTREVPLRPGAPVRLRGVYDRDGNFRPLDEERQA